MTVFTGHPTTCFSCPNPPWWVAPVIFLSSLFPKTLMSHRWKGWRKKFGPDSLELLHFQGRLQQTCVRHPYGSPQTQRNECQAFVAGTWMYVAGIDARESGRSSTRTIVWQPSKPDTAQHFVPWGDVPGDGWTTVPCFLYDACISPGFCFAVVCQSTCTKSLLAMFGDNPPTLGN